MSKILLDTNAIIAYLAGDHEVLQVLEEADIIFLSIFVIGELYAGFKGGNQEQKNKSILNTFQNKSGVTAINAGQETAEIFAHLKNILKQAGTPLPINDIWIAAHAVEFGCVVVTYDKHFHNIPGLRLWR